MTLIGRRKKKTPFEQGLGYVGLVLKGLVAQRLARKAYTGYKWTRRLPYLVAGAGLAAAVAFAVRKATQSRRASEAGVVPSPEEHPSTTATAAASPPATTPSTPTPTGSPTAVTPAPTAAGDGSPTSEDEDAEPKA